jgi:hypothetical protein
MIAAKEGRMKTAVVSERVSHAPTIDEIYCCIRVNEISVFVTGVSRSMPE